MAGTERPDVEPEVKGESVDDEHTSEDVEKQTEQKEEISQEEDTATDDNTYESLKEEEAIHDSPKEESVAKMEETIPEEKNDNKENNNLIRVELCGNETERNSPEIVVEPKFSERLPSCKLAAQNIRVMTPKYYSLPPVRKQTPPTLKTEKRFRFPVKKFKRCFLLILFSTTVIGYAIGGAYLFSYLERKRDIEYNAKIDKWKNDTAILLATELRQVVPHEEVWARKVFKYLEVFEKDLLKASAIGYRRFDHKDREQRWTWKSSLYFSVALMTTTGYGPMTPRSNVGRTAAAFYSLFGIPLALSWLLVVGYTLATFWASLFQNICCRLCHERPPENEENPYSATKAREPIKLPKVRTNSIVPMEEQKLIARTDSQLSHSGSGRRSMFPSEFKKEGNERNNNHMKLITGSTQNSACSVRRTEIENARIREVYHTMDYATAIVYALLLFVVYYMFFSILFSLYEGFILTDVLYFSFLMFLTLGPGCYEMEDDLSEIRIKNNLLYTIHLCIGYCIIAMIANLFYLLFRGKCETDRGQKRETFDSFPRGKF